VKNSLGVQNLGDVAQGEHFQIRDWMRG